AVGHREASGQGDHGGRATRRPTRPIREGGTAPAVVTHTLSDMAIFLPERGVRAKRDPKSPWRADRAPGGLLGGKDPAGRLLQIAPSVVGQHRSDAALLGEQRVAAVAEKVHVEELVDLPLAVALDGDGDRL